MAVIIRHRQTQSPDTPVMPVYREVVRQEETEEDAGDGSVTA